jgi:AsmA protein
VKKRTRILAITAGLIVVLIAAGVAMLPALMTLDGVKGQIAETLSQATGRPVTIHRLSLSVFPWLGIRLDGAVLGNAPGFGPAPLARVDDARIEVRLFPLFNRHIVLRRVILTGLRLSLQENKAGLTNWATLIHGPKPPRTRAAAKVEAHEAPAFVLVRAAGLTVRRARIRYHNARTHGRDTLSDLTLRLGAIVPGRPVTIGMHALLKTMGHPPLPFRLAAQATYKAPGLTLAPLHLWVADLVAHGRLHVLHTATGISAHGRLVVPPFAPRPLLTALGLHYTPRDPHVLKQASANMGLHWDPSALTLAPLRLTLDKTTMTGRITRIAHPLLYEVHLAIDHLRPMSYLPAPPPANAPPSQRAPSPVPAAPAASSMITSLPLVAAISCGHLRIHGLVATNLRAHIRSFAGHVVVKPLTMALYQGRFAGTIKAVLTGHPRTWRVRGLARNVQTSAVLRALHLFPEFSGALDANVHLHGSGTKRAAIERSVSGRLTASMPNGVLRGIDLDFVAKDPKAVAGAHRARANQGTTFSGLHASATVARGVVHMNALALHTTRAVIHGHGRVILATKSINYLLDVALPSGFVIPVRVQGPAGHIKFTVSLNRLFSDSTHNGLGSTLQTLGGALKHALGIP